MRIRFFDGNEFEGNSYNDLVNNLRKLDASQKETTEEYMKVAKNRFEMLGVDVQTDSPKGFIESLQQQNMLEIIS